MSVCIHHTSSPVISQEEKQLLKEDCRCKPLPGLPL